MNNRPVALIALLMALGIFFGYINPTWNGTIADANAAIATDDQALLAANQYTARQNALVAARAAINPTDLSHLMTFLPDSANNVGVILDLNALAARSGFSLSDVDVAVAAASAAPSGAGGNAVSPVSSIDLSINAVGTYTAFHKFIDGIERSQRLLDVRSLTIKGSDSGIYTYQMVLRLYWLR